MGFLNFVAGNKSEDSRIPVTFDQLAAIHWDFCFDGIRELRDILKLHLPDFETRGSPGKNDRFFESAILHLCMNSIALLDETQLAQRTIEAFIDHARDCGATRDDLTRFATLYRLRFDAYGNALQDAASRNPRAIFDEAIKNVANGGAYDSELAGNSLLRMGCMGHLGFFVDRIVSLRSKHRVIP